MVKGKRIREPLSEGLPSRIYLAAYPNWITSYQIAKLILPGSKPKDSAGRITKTVSNYIECFEREYRRITEFKMVTAIRSRVKPFLERLAGEFRLEPNEKAALEPYLESGFRRAVGEHLEGLLKMTPNYLSRDVNAFQELSSLLAFMLFGAKIYHTAPDFVKEFASSVVVGVAPRLLGEEETAIKGYLELMEDMPREIPLQTIIKLYGKLNRGMEMPAELSSDFSRLLELFSSLLKEPEIGIFIKETAKKLLSKYKVQANSSVRRHAENAKS